jgi:trimethylamine--corrinoid protein Co-methyltransferase
MRLPKVEDLIRFSRLSDTLEHIEATSTAIIPSEVPDEISDSIRLYVSCLYSDKPVVTGTFSQTAFRIMRDLLVCRTGKDSLRDTPCAIFDVCPSSPLRWSELGCHDLRACAQNTIPVQFISMPLAGALAPMSLLANVVQHAAETLSGVVIHQAWTPGSPLVWGGSPALFDMRHSTSPMGAVETLLVDLADAEVGKHLGLPTQVYLGMSDSKALDAQAGLETAMTLALASTGSVDFVSGPGMLNFESCQCLEKLVLDNNTCGMMRRLKRGMEPRGATLGIDAIRQGLEEGNFLTTEETLSLYRQEAFYPTKIIDRKAFKEEGKVDAGRLVTQARDEIETRLAVYTPPDIDGTNLADMKSVMEEALAPFGMKDLAEKCLESR